MAKLPGFSQLYLLIALAASTTALAGFSVYQVELIKNDQGDSVPTSTAPITTSTAATVANGSIVLTQLSPELQALLAAKNESKVATAGTVTSVTAGDGLSGGKITEAGVLSLNTSSANTWSAEQVFAAGLRIGNGAVLNNVAGAGLQLIAGTLTTTLGVTVGTTELEDASVTLPKLASTGCANGQILTLTASAWSCAAPSSFVAGVASINGLTAQNQTLTLQSTGAGISDVTLVSEGSAHTLTIPTASGTTRGVLSATDWSIFNSKQGGLTFGDLSSSTAGVSVTNGTGAVIGSGVGLSIQTASSTSAGLLSAADWSAFNDKQDELILGAGLRMAGSTITNTFGTGLSDGQLLIGAVDAGGDLTITSTASTTKGKIFFGTAGSFVYDESFDAVGIAMAGGNPTAMLQVGGGPLYGDASNAGITDSVAAPSVWQSFTAASNGVLREVSFYLGAPVAGDSDPNATIGAMFRIYAGEGTAGRLITERAITIRNTDSIIGESEVIFNTVLPMLNQGETYTFEIVPDGYVTPNDWIMVNANNEYANGRSSTSVTDDLSFEVVMAPDSVMGVMPWGVGIGTAAPQHLLDIRQSRDDQTALSVASTSPTLDDSPLAAFSWSPDVAQSSSSAMVKIVAGENADPASLFEVSKGFTNIFSVTSTAVVLNGAQVNKTTEITTATYTATATDTVLFVNPTVIDDNVTITLPPTLGVSGRRMSIHRLDYGGSANHFILAATGGLVDASASVSILNTSSIELISKGSDWLVVNRYLND